MIGRRPTLHRLSAPYTDEGPLLARRSVRVLAWRVVAGALALAATVVIARGLGPEGFGAYAVYAAMSATLVFVATLGLDEGNLYAYAARRIPLPALHGMSALVAFTAGTSGVALMAFLPTLMPGVFGDASPSLLLLAGIVIPFTVHQRLAGGLQTMDGRLTRHVMARALASAAQVIAMLLVIARLPAITVWWVLAIQAGAVLVAWLGTVGPSGARGPVGPWNLTLLRDTLRYALPQHLAPCLLFLHLRVDLFMLKSLAGPDSVGLYAVAVLLAEMIPPATEWLAAPLLMRHVGNSLQESAVAALHGARMHAIVGIALSVVWVLGGYGAIVLLFGPAFARAYGPLLALLPAMIILGMQIVCGPVGLRAGGAFQMAGIHAAAVAVHVALNFSLIPSFGLVGAAFAATFSCGLGCLVFLVWTARLAALPLTDAIPTPTDVREAFVTLLAIVRGPNYKPRPKRKFK